MNTSEIPNDVPTVETTPCPAFSHIEDARFNAYKTIRTKHPFDPKSVNAFDEAEWLADFNAIRTVNK